MLPLDLSSFPPLDTPRLHLRPVVLDDAPAVLALRSDPVTMAYIPRPLIGTLHEAESFVHILLAEQNAQETFMWAMTVKGDAAMIGIIGFLRMRKEHFRTELGYMLAPAHWGKGYTTEAIAAVVRHAFDAFGFHSIEALVDPRNVASARVLEHNGFVREGLFRENFFFNGEYQDTAVYTRLRP